MEMRYSSQKRRDESVRVRARGRGDIGGWLSFIGSDWVKKREGVRVKKEGKVLERVVAKCMTQFTGCLAHNG